MHTDIGDNKESIDCEMSISYYLECPECKSIYYTEQITQCVNCNETLIKKDLIDKDGKTYCIPCDNYVESVTTCPKCNTELVDSEYIIKLDQLEGSEKWDYLFGDMKTKLYEEMMNEEMMRKIDEEISDGCYIPPCDDGILMAVDFNERFCPKCKVEYTDVISNVCNSCGTALVTEKDFNKREIE